MKPTDGMWRWKKTAILRVRVMCGIPEKPCPMSIMTASRGSIRRNIRVMTFQDDLPEEEKKSEWAMDIAFDMDRVFPSERSAVCGGGTRRHTQQRKKLYESLMTRAAFLLWMKSLAALGQTQEDYLPSEIEKFKDATGYERNFWTTLTLPRSRQRWRTRRSPMRMKCCPLRKRQNGSTWRRRPPMCRHPPISQEQAQAVRARYLFHPPD